MTEPGQGNTCRFHDGAINKLNNAIYGNNGEGGLITEVKLLEQGQKMIKREVRGSKKLMWSVIVLLILTLGLVVSTLKLISENMVK